MCAFEGIVRTTLNQLRIYLSGVFSFTTQENWMMKLKKFKADHISALEREGYLPDVVMRILLSVWGGPVIRPDGTCVCFEIAVWSAGAAATLTAIWSQGINRSEIVDQILQHIPMGNI